MSEYQPKTATNLSDISKLIAEHDRDRTIYWFQVPKKTAKRTGINRIGLVELTAGEELMATSRASNNAIKLAFELAKESVRYVDNERISSGDGSSDVFWSKKVAGMSMIRQMILNAYGKIHNPDPEEVGDFLESMVQTNG